ncbi:hypothetical protein F4801DRAFT_558763 [Xylaria longipes]|nr:hypothetical protein F4801DRAFT_558763 [Xylaria longipes]
MRRLGVLLVLLSPATLKLPLLCFTVDSSRLPESRISRTQSLINYGSILLDSLVVNYIENAFCEGQLRRNRIHSCILFYNFIQCTF